MDAAKIGGETISKINDANDIPNMDANAKQFIVDDIIKLGQDKIDALNARKALMAKMKPLMVKKV